MNTSHELLAKRPWLWMGCAFFAGIAVGMVVGAVGLIALAALANHGSR